MTQGFDEWFKKRHTKSGLYEKTLLNDDDALYLKHEMRKAHKAGAASRQDEVSNLQIDIDELKRELEILQGMHNAVSLTARGLVDERDGLKKRIEDVLNTIEPSEEISHMLYREVYKILKGESNER